MRQLAAKCNFRDLHDELIRDRVILGLQCEDTRRHLLLTQDLTLDKAIPICRSEETARATIRDIQRQSTDVVHKIIKTGKQTAAKDSSSKPDAKIIQCKFCGRKHQCKKELCPAYGKKCKNCGKSNHFAIKCTKREKKTNQVDDDTDSVESVDMVKSEQLVYTIKNTKIFADMMIRSTAKQVSFQIDTGSSVNILPIKFMPKDKEIGKTPIILKSWTGNRITPVGSARIVIENPSNSKKYRLAFIIVKEDLTPILGLRASEAMNLVTINNDNFKEARINEITVQSEEDIVNSFPTVFDDGIGSLPGEQHLVVNQEIKPTVNPVRRVPHSLVNDLKRELNKMEDDKVITKVYEPTQWESSLVTPHKKESGKLRVCIDPPKLNTALQRERYYLPVMDDILPKLQNAKVFSVLDLKSGYWHVKLDEESSFLTTFNTQFGRYRWLRLPFGLNVSAEIFQRKLHQVLSDIEGIACIADDIIVIGNGVDVEEATKIHDQRLLMLLKRCEDVGIKLNKAKMQLRKSSIKFLGHIVTSEGLKPDPEKIKAIRDMKEPSNVTELRGFIGFVQYLAKFLPNLSDVIEPLRKLTKQDMKWKWSDKESKAFNKTKEMLAKEPVLRYYDPKEQLEIQCDASDIGLGEALLQNGQPIAYSSRALTETEQRYAPIEKEMLAITWSVEKYHQYTYGRQTTVKSDHKPLERIMIKPLKDIPRRLQGFR